MLKTINYEEKTDWNMFTAEERLNLQNTVLLVGLLVKMTKVKLVKSANTADGINTVIDNARATLTDAQLSY